MCTCVGVGKSLENSTMLLCYVFLQNCRAIFSWRGIGEGKVTKEIISWSLNYLEVKGNIINYLINR